MTRTFFIISTSLGLALLLGVSATPAVADGKSDLAGAQAADQRHDAATAIPLYDHAIASGTLSPDQQGAALRGRALDERDQRQFDKAIADDTAAIALHADDEQAFVDRATVYAYSGNADAAIADLTTALGLKSNDVTALADRGALFAARHDLTRALTDLNAAIKTAPNDVGALLNRAAAYHGLGDNDKAIADLDIVIRQRPDLAGAYYDRGNAWRDKGDSAHAIADYSAAIHLNPNYGDAYNNRGTAYQQAAQYAKALADFAAAIRLAPNNPSAYYNRGNVYRDLNQNDNAIADYDTLIYLSPNFTGGYNGRGYANFNAGRFAAAGNDFKRSLALDGNQLYPILWLHLARVRQRQTDGDEFAANLQHSDAQAWPAPVAGFLMHKLTAAELATAAGQGDAKTRSARACDVNFFKGQEALGARQGRTARKYFIDARKICPIVSPAYSGALAALQQRAGF